MIPDSKGHDSGLHKKNLSDSGFHRNKIPEFWIPFYGVRPYLNACPPFTVTVGKTIDTTE